MPTESHMIAAALSKVCQDISHSEARHSRTAGSVHLIAVSKTKSVEQIVVAIDTGQRDFGENYIDEALEKIAKLGHYNCCWHFIGDIQSNKTRHVAAHFDWAHCIGRQKIAQRLSQQRPPHLPPLNICIQVNIDEEASKSGVLASEAPALAGKIAKLPNLCLRGLMAIPSPSDHFDSQRKPFTRMHTLLKSMQYTHPSMDTLSMGMSADLEAAIAEGTTMVRIGTAIFSARSTK